MSTAPAAPNFADSLPDRLTLVREPVAGLSIGAFPATAQGRRMAAVERAEKTRIDAARGRA